MSKDEIEFYLAIGGFIFGSFGILATIFYRFFHLPKLKRIEEKAALKAWQKDIEKRLHLLDCPEAGRVHKLSKLTEEQINTNKVAYGLAKEVQGFQKAQSKS